MVLGIRTLTVHSEPQTTQEVSEAHRVRESRSRSGTQALAPAIRLGGVSSRLLLSSGGGSSLDKDSRYQAVLLPTTSK